MEDYDSAAEPTAQPSDFWHVYDDLSQTPFRRGGGIRCGARSVLPMNDHLLARELRRHLDWSNREPTRLISLYDNFADAVRACNARRNNVLYPRDWDTIRIARVRFTSVSRTRPMSRFELAERMTRLGNISVLDWCGHSEWLIWGDIPNSCVVDIIDPFSRRRAVLSHQNEHPALAHTWRIRPGLRNLRNGPPIIWTPV